MTFPLQNFSDYDAFLDDDIDGLMEEMTEDDFGHQHNMLNSNCTHSTSDNRGVNQITSNMQNRNSAHVVTKAVNGRSNQHGSSKLSNIKTSGSQRNNGIHENIDIKNSTTQIRPPSELSHQMLPRSSGGHIIHNDDLVGMDFQNEMDDDCTTFMTSPSNYSKSRQILNKAPINIPRNQNITNNRDANNENGSNNQKVGPTTNSSLNLMTCSRPVILSDADMTLDIASKGVHVSTTSRNPVTAKTTITTSINRNSVKPLSGSLIKVKTETSMKSKPGTDLEQRCMKNQQGMMESFFTPNKIQKMKHEQSEMVHGTSDLGIFIVNYLYFV